MNCNLKLRYVVTVIVCWVAVICGSRAARADFVYAGRKWGDTVPGTPATVTWSVVPPTSYYQDFDTIFPVGYRDEFRAAFAAWSEVANIQFVEVPDTGPSGSQIRLHLNPPNTDSSLAYAYYPGTAAHNGDVFFNSNIDWFIEPEGTGFELYGDVFQVAMHEIGHAIGLQHSNAVPAVMSARNSGYRGLLSSDIAGAQHIYGAAPGWIAPNPENVQLDLTDASRLEVTFRAFDGNLELTDSSPIAGQIAAYLGHGAGGQLDAFAIRNSELNALADMSFAYDQLPLFYVDAELLGLRSALVSTSDCPVAPDGSFDPEGTVLGLTGGTLDFAAGSPALGIEGAADLDFIHEALSLPVLAGGHLGSLVETAGLAPGERDVHLQVPIHVETTVDFHIFVDDLPPGTLLVDIVVDGMIDARGSYFAVPEPSLTAPLLLGTLLAGVRTRHRRRRD